MDLRSIVNSPVLDKQINNLFLLIAASYGLLYLHLDQFSSVLTGSLALVILRIMVVRQRLAHFTVLLYLFYAVVAWQLLVWGYNHAFYPEFAERSPKAERLGVWFMLCPIAFITSGKAGHVFGLWMTGVISVLLAPWLSGNGLNEIVQAFKGIRSGFGVNNAQHMGMLYGVAFLGLSVFSQRFFIYFQRTKKHWLGLVLLIAWLMAAAGLLITQTRAIWLAVVVTMALSLGWWLIAKVRNARRGGNTTPLPVHKNLIVAALLLLIALPFVFSDLVLNRLDESEYYGWISMLKHPAATKNPSVKIRYVTWKESLSWITERPITGWGRKGSDLAVNATPELTAVEKRQFRHLHNSYLDLTVNYGLVGLGLFFSLLYLISKSVYKAFAKDPASSDIVLFWNMFLIYWLIVNMFESYMFYSTGTYVFALVAGGVLGLSINKDRRGNSSSTAAAAS